MELCLDGVHILENVSVVVLQVVDDEGAGLIVEEFRTAVEVGSVVFVRLDHKVGRLAQAGGTVEILGRAANQIAGVKAGAVQDPSQHACGGGFAVGAGHRQHPAVPQQVGAQPLGPGDVAQTAVENVLHRVHAPGQSGVADDDQVWGRLQLGRVEAFVDGDAVRGQQVAHRWIDVLVGAAHLMALLLGEQSQAAH